MLILKTQDRNRLTMTSVRLRHQKQMRKEQLGVRFHKMRLSLIKQLEQQYARIKVLPTCNSPPIYPKIVANHNNFYPLYQMPISPVIQNYNCSVNLWPNMQIPQHQLEKLPSAYMAPQKQASNAITERQSKNHKEIKQKHPYPILTSYRNYIVYNKLLGEGAYSQVYLGSVGSRSVAVKVVNKLEQNELRCLEELESQYLIKMEHMWREATRSYLVMELCESNLREEMQSCSYELSKAKKYFSQIVEGMNDLFSKNVIHRDLKFENILVKDGRIKISDFGLAKFMGSELQVESRKCGTPYTMAPQVYFTYGKPNYSIKSDIWSLGIILHELLYRKHPFGTKIERFKDHNRVKVVKKFGILDRLIDQCLIYKPQQRISWLDFKEIYYQTQDKKKLTQINKNEIAMYGNIYEKKRNQVLLCKMRQKIEYVLPRNFNEAHQNAVIKISKAIKMIEKVRINQCQEKNHIVEIKNNQEPKKQITNENIIKKPQQAVEKMQEEIQSGKAMSNSKKMTIPKVRMLKEIIILVIIVLICYQCFRLMM